MHKTYPWHCLEDGHGYIISQWMSGCERAEYFVHGTTEQRGTAPSNARWSDISYISILYQIASSWLLAQARGRRKKSVPCGLAPTIEPTGVHGSEDWLGGGVVSCQLKAAWKKMHRTRRTFERGQTSRLFLWGALATQSWPPLISDRFALICHACRG